MQGLSPRLDEAIAKDGHAVRRWVEGECGRELPAWEYCAPFAGQKLVASQRYDVLFVALLDGTPQQGEAELDLGVDRRPRQPERLGLRDRIGREARGLGPVPCPPARAGLREDLVDVRTRGPLVVEGRRGAGARIWQRLHGRRRASSTRWA